MKSAVTNGSLKLIWARRCHNAGSQGSGSLLWCHPCVKGISLRVEDGQIVTLIGSNGAGKSTTLHTISGLIKPRSGNILFDGTDITGTPAHKIVASGLVQVPEGRHVFANMSVMENLDMGAYLRKDKDGIEKDKKKVFEPLPPPF